MTKVRTNFSQQTIYIGLDVHKRSWNAALYLNDQYLRNVHQPPSAHALYKYLHSHYPGARYVCAYESGKFGYWIHRQLSGKDIECIVVNPADIPSAQKDDLQKTDPRDARGIAKALQRDYSKAFIFRVCSRKPTAAWQGSERKYGVIWFVAKTG